MTTFTQLIASLSTDNKTRGDEFEKLCKWLLETDPVYTNKLKKVWLWKDWPGRWGSDLGIDLIAQDDQEKIWAIQAKCYDPSYSITKTDIDSFLSESSNLEIHNRLLIATTDNLGSNAVSVIQRAHALKPFNQLLLSELVEKQLDWPSSVSDLFKGSVRKPHNPKPHQQRAIDDVVSGLNQNSRGQLIMACGTGKTLAALWIAETLKSQTTLVLLPSLLLLSKTLAEWLRHSKQPFSYLPVCSDDSVANTDDDSVSYKTFDLSFPSTTDPIEIAAFLEKEGRKVIFSTYQSSRQLAAAYRIAALKPIDLVICDEAHRCAGKAGADYTVVLDNKEIPAAKRLFMTATPKIFQAHIKKKAEETGNEVISMDDPVLFGPEIHKLSFGEAITQELLSDYQVVIVGVDDLMCAEMISERTLIKTENKIETDAQSFASHIGLAKVIKEYDLRRIISFHSRVKSAQDFQEAFAEVVDWMPKESRPTGDFVTNYVSGAMSTGQRNQNLRRLGELEGDERAILSNARCLSEGVDVPALDGVAFIDPRNSEIDIVQAVGRAIRLSSGKTVGTIVIPVFIAAHEDPEEVLNDSAFKKVWSVVNALRAHDEGLGNELDILRQQLGKRGSVGKVGKIHFDLPTSITVDFEKALSVRLLESTTASWEFWFGLLVAYKEEHGDCSVSQKYKSADGYYLGRWINKQRERSEQLSLEKIQRLNELGFVWDMLNERWEEGFAHLKAYKEECGDCWVPGSFQSADGFTLGIWVGTQRVSKESLAPDRIQRLNELGFVWDVLTEQWEEGFAHLKTYKEKHGDCSVPKNYKSADGYKLGSWVGTKRLSKETLAPERIQRLNELGFVWDMLTEKWEEGFAHLKKYKEEYGDCLVPQNFKSADSFTLGSWVGTQRTKKEQLSLEKIQRLNELGFVWDVLTEQWEEGFAHLKTYKEEYGDCRVPTNYKSADGFKLGLWVIPRRAKKEQLSLVKIQCLNELGFVWDVLTEQWEEGFAHLKTYKEEYGDCRVPTNYKSAGGYSLGLWVSNRRAKTEQLSLEKFQRLNELGFVWDMLNERWEEGFDHLKAYKEEHGDCSVPKDYKSADGFALGNWVGNQRIPKVRENLGKQNVHRLDELGFIWNPFVKLWEEGFARLKAYKEENSHCRVPQNFKSADGFGLGSWVARQRAVRTDKTLTADKIQRLDELGFIWKLRE